MQILFNFYFHKGTNDESIIKYEVYTLSRYNEKIMLIEQEKEFSQVFINMLNKNQVNYRLPNEKDKQDKQVISEAKIFLEKQSPLLIAKMHFALYDDLYSPDNFTLFDAIQDIKEQPQPYWHLNANFNEEKWNKFLEEISKWVDLNPTRIKKFKDFYN
jgi:hypothetical protein